MLKRFCWATKLFAINQIPVNCGVGSQKGIKTAQLRFPVEPVTDLYRSQVLSITNWMLPVKILRSKFKCRIKLYTCQAWPKSLLSEADTITKAGIQVEKDRYWWLVENRWMGKCLAVKWTIMYILSVDKGSPTISNYNCTLERGYV